MLVPSPTQATAVVEWLEAALNTDDLGAPLVPTPFPLGTVFPGERDHPRADRFARVATISLVSRGAHRQHVVLDPQGPGRQLVERMGEHREWTTSITVASRIDPEAPALADEAGQHLQRALGRFRSVAATYPLRAVGVAPIRQEGMVDVARLTGTRQWETRCSATLVWLCGWTAQTPVEPVERVTGYGFVPDVLPEQLIWRPLARSDWDPVTQQKGVNVGVDWDPGEDAWIFSPSSDNVLWSDVYDWSGRPATVSMWVWFDDMVERRPLLVRSTTGGGAIFVNSNTTGNLRFWHQNTGGASASRTSVAGVVEPARWYHLVFTYDGSNTQAGMGIWVDGQEVAYAGGVDGSGTPLATRDWNLGYGLASSVSHLGRIRDVRAWGAILTADQIASVRAQRPLPFDSDAGAM